MLHLSADSFFALHKTNRQERPIFRKEGELTSFASNKIQILELVCTPGHKKPSNCGHMISHGQEAYPVGLEWR